MPGSSSYPFYLLWSSNSFFSSSFFTLNTSCWHESARKVKGWYTFTYTIMITQMSSNYLITNRRKNGPPSSILLNTCHLDWRGAFFQFPVSSNTILKSKLPRIANWMLACKLAYDATCVVHQLINFFSGVPCASLFSSFFTSFRVPELIGIETPRYSSLI